jgi:hypothetical protein
MADPEEYMDDDDIDMDDSDDDLEGDDGIDDDEDDDDDDGEDMNDVEPAAPIPEPVEEDAAIARRRAIQAIMCDLLLQFCHNQKIAPAYTTNEIAILWLPAAIEFLDVASATMNSVHLAIHP